MNYIGYFMLVHSYYIAKEVLVGIAMGSTAMGIVYEPNAKLRAAGLLVLVASWILGFTSFPLMKLPWWPHALLGGVAFILIALDAIINRSKASLLAAAALLVAGIVSWLEVLVTHGV